MLIKDSPWASELGQSGSLRAKRLGIGFVPSHHREAGQEQRASLTVCEICQNLLRTQNYTSHSKTWLWKSSLCDSAGRYLKTKTSPHPMRSVLVIIFMNFLSFSFLSRFCKNCFFQTVMCFLIHNIFMLNCCHSCPKWVYDLPCLEVWWGQQAAFSGVC